MTKLNENLEIGNSGKTLGDLLDNDWKYLGQTQGQFNFIQLPSDWKELMVFATMNNGERQLTGFLLKQMLKYATYNTNGYTSIAMTAFAMTGSSSSTTVQGGIFTYNKTDNSISGNYFPGFTSSTKCYFYYR